MPKLPHKDIPADVQVDGIAMGGTVDTSGISIPEEIRDGWQVAVDALAEITGGDAAILYTVEPPCARVICSGGRLAGRYPPGSPAPLKGRCREALSRKGDRRIITDAACLELLREGPDAREGMVSHAALPLPWPNGEVFGLISVLDSRPDAFEPAHERLLLGYQELIRTQLALLYQHLADRNSLLDILDDLSEGIIVHDCRRRILLFNRAAEEITGYNRADILGKDCHEAFGEAFCGGRCTFRDDSPGLLDHRAYPLHILKRTGEPRRIEMAVTGRYDAEKRLVGVIASFRDVTDLIELQIEAVDLKGFAGIVGKAPKMREVYRHIRDLATNDYPVHISGETGTGKELVAAAIHNESRRGGGPFVPVNCAALPEGMLESELFGHVRGAFTGALRDKKGRFELADGGTLFLDEVADLPGNMQAKLLRVLQEGTFDRVGGERPLSVDVRVISATNRDLKREVEGGRFRADLYYRVNVVPVRIPPLREREDDIDLLLEYFLKQAQAEGQESPGLSPEAVFLMKRYRWPGNVRELQSAVRFALVKSRGRIIRPRHLPLELREYREKRGARGPAGKLKEENVRTALAEAGGNKAKAARILRVGRATLYRYLNGRKMSHDT